MAVYETPRVAFELCMYSENLDLRSSLNYHIGYELISFVLECIELNFVMLDQMSFSALVLPVQLPKDLFPRTTVSWMTLLNVYANI